MRKKCTNTCIYQKLFVPLQREMNEGTRKGSLTSYKLG